MSAAAPKIRLYVPGSYQPGQLLNLNSDQSHYVANVMRTGSGDALAVFNGADGEWLAEVASLGKKSVTLALKEQRKPHKASPDLWLAFAPIKNKSDLVVEKATELGVSKLIAVVTRHCVVKSINREKLETHAIEAAEQCERLDVPVLEECNGINELLESWPKDRALLYGDESGQGAPLKDVLAAMKAGPCGVLVGPEGGFSAEEHKYLKTWPQVKPFGMGPRILRADTAAVAALACLQNWLGDWQEKPRFLAAE